MIKGRISESLEAKVELLIYSSEGKRIFFGAVIDTGFTEHLTLSPQLVRQLGFTPVAKTTVVLADGKTSAMSMCPATIQWDGQDREITVLVAEGTPLIGMALLENFILTMEVVEQGEVLITRRNE